MVNFCRLVLSEPPRSVDVKFEPTPQDNSPSMQVRWPLAEERKVIVQMSFVVTELVREHLSDGQLQIGGLYRPYKAVSAVQWNRQVSTWLFSLFMQRIKFCNFAHLSNSSV